MREPTVPRTPLPHIRISVRRNRKEAGFGSKYPKIDTLPYGPL